MTMREDVRAAFERQQSELGDVVGARDRLLQGAMVNRDRPASSRLQWAAGVAAILIAVIVITTFALVKAGSHTSRVPAATPSPRAQVSPTPLRNVLNVPDSTPIVTYGDPSANGQLDGITWDGKTSGMLPNQSVAAGNPQNNLFAGTTSVTDRAGATVMSGSFGLKSFQGTWSDDGRHICLMTPFDNPGGAGIPTTLQLVTIGGATRNVMRIGTLYNQTVMRVAACSTRSDRAVVVQSGGQGVGTSQLWMVRLSTGRVIWTHSYSGRAADVTVVASMDANYVAEDLIQNGPAGSTVYGPDGSPVTALSDWIEAFSSDASLAVVDGGLGTGSARLISWRDNRVVWAAPYHWVQVGVRAQPDGGAMAIWATPPVSPNPPLLYIVTATGSVIEQIAGATPLYP